MSLPSPPFDEDSNESDNRRFDEVLQARLSRRRLLMASAGVMAATAFGVTGCAGPGGAGRRSRQGLAEVPLLRFRPVAKSVADTVAVPPGYTATVLLAVGDPLFEGVGAYANDGTDGNFERRCGDWHDGMQYFGLGHDGSRDDGSSDRGLLGINHEWVSPVFLHAGGATGMPRPAEQVDIETAAMGVTIVEVAKDEGGRFAYVPDSRFNRRITTLTETEISGPARGHPRLRTRFAPDGTRTRGTINNCGTGKTPWGTLLTGEENWFAFFARDAGDDGRRGAGENAALGRYGRPPGSAHAYGWDTVSATEDEYRRWNTSVTGTSADGTDDYRHEINGQGWMTEIDPYDPSSTIRKRTALGRMAHEGAAFSLPAAGRPLAVYMGDDAPGEYIYKYVSKEPWDPADAWAADRMAVGDKYLDRGTLYAARLHDDGTGEWLALGLATPAVADYGGYAFADEGDVLIHARIAADAAGATRMDRPEWSTTNPANGEVFITLTNNSARTLDAADDAMPVDAPNPRAYDDVHGERSVFRGNVNGHILRLRDADPAAPRFEWDVYLFGAESDADEALINLSGLTADQDFSSPDGIGFASSTGLCWIQTDDDAMTDRSNSMMLAALPGGLGDGRFVELDHGTAVVTTRKGRNPSARTLKRFLVGPVDQEITGLAETPDGRVLFVNVQHPGSRTPADASGDPGRYTSHWPGNAGYGAGGAEARPRSATLMIVKNDGGLVGQ